MKKQINMLTVHFFVVIILLSLTISAYTLLDEELLISVTTFLVLFYLVRLIEHSLIKLTAQRSIVVYKLYRLTYTSSVWCIVSVLKFLRTYQFWLHLHLAIMYNIAEQVGAFMARQYFMYIWMALIIVGPIMTFIMENQELFAWPYAFE